MQPVNPPEVKQIIGHLDAFIEQGMEGHAWVLEEDGKEGYEGLHSLSKGDVLVIFNDAARKEQIWCGVIDLEFESHIRALPRATWLQGQWLEAVGTVLGIQRNTDAEAWAKMFTGNKPAILIPGPNNRINFTNKS